MPEADEIEVSVFGGGYGEAIAVHLGNSEWVLVDSCLHPTSGQPASLDYLRRLGVQIDSDVKLVVVTHWDDDHIRGISEIVSACASARVACSAAINKREVIQFVIAQESQRGVVGSGLDELRTVLRLCATRKPGITWARANLPLHPVPPGDDASVIALSPSDDAVQRSLTSLVEQATGKPRVVKGRYQAPEGPNGASVAISVRRAWAAIILGADLEVSSNTEAGWEAVLSYAKPPDVATLVKVPHHGSPGAHHEAFWLSCISGEAIAIVAPWSNGGNFIPKEEDLKRLQAASGRVFVTAAPGLRRMTQSTAARGLIRKLHGNKEIFEFANWGHVRARRRPGEEWRVDLTDDAAEVSM